MRVSLLAVALALVGCAAAPERTEPAPEVAKAQETVTVPCVDKVPARPPLLADTEWAKQAVDEDMRVKVLKVDRRRLLEHVETLEALLAACAQGGAP